MYGLLFTNNLNISIIKKLNYYIMYYIIDKLYQNNDNY